MTVKRNSPLRRNSFAVANKNQAHPGRKRRAHSIAPGDHLSPSAKARRSLAPRKSILKAAANAPDDGDDVTQTMDMTRDYREDNPTRKSLGRRVSFANHAHVRLFEVPDHNTNSTTSPQSSPAAEPDPDTPRPTNDENAYPGARARRRSSARHSMVFSEGGGEESMDMDSDDTAFSPSAFFRAGAEGSVNNEFNDLDRPSDGDDMDVTEVVPRDFVRKRSLSFGIPRQPLANLSIPQPSPHTRNDQDDTPNETSYVEEESAQSQSFTSEGDVSQPMEFTVPLVRPPEPPSEAWLALRSVTHSGNTPYIPLSDDGGDVQEMELTDAVSRLQAARASLGLDEAGGEGGGDSFTSTEDSFIDDEAVGNAEDGNQTINVTQLMRRVSLGPGADSTVTSAFSSQEQSREEAINQPVEIPPSAPSADSDRIYPAVPASPPSVATPADSQVLCPETSANDDSAASAAAAAEPSTSSDRPPVFSTAESMSQEARPVSSGTVPQAPAIPEPTNFTFKPLTVASSVRSRSSSPTKAPSSPKKFTAAFAPPITRPSLQKRSNDAIGTDHGSQPSPAKRPSGLERLSITPGRGTGAVRVLLSPSKTSPLKMPPFQDEGQHDVGQSMRTPIGFRRPSGYFAQRKSLGNGVLDPTMIGRNSPTKKAAALLGRKSVGSMRLPAENVGREDVTNRRSASPTKVDDPKGQERSSERLPLPDILIRASPRPTPIPDQDTQPDHIDDAQLRDEIEEGTDCAQEPQMSIEQFFEMTGVRFMDDIAAPRRSIVHPSVLRPSRRASVDSQIPLAEYVVAMAVNVPQLELYNHVCKDLQTWVERIKEIHEEAEEEVQRATPPLFQEFVTTDESGQAELLHQLKLIKVHNHAQAKSEWYDWKMQWVEQLHQKANEGFENLEADAKALEGIIRQAQDIVPALQQEYDELVAELAKEKAEVAELEGCDQDYLNELKVTIAEQSVELETYHADVEEAGAKLDRLQEKLNEAESQKKEVASSVEDAERRIYMQRNSTRAEIFQLKDELEALESLHMWKATKIHPDLFEFIYASVYCISIPCIRFRPVVAGIQIRRIENVKAKQVFPVLSAVVLRTANRLITEQGDQSIRQVVQRLGDYWSSCTQIQTHLKLVSIKFPLSIEETPTGFSATAMVMIPSRKAKALISFIFDTPVISSWPELIQSLRCDVKVAYGAIDRDTIQNAVTGRLRQATPINNHACLLDACMEASDCFT